MAGSHWLSRSLVVGLVIWLGACATHAPPESAPVPTVKPPPPVVTPPARQPQAPPPRPAAHPTVAALQPLLARAGQAREQGDYEQSLALLERAQRLDPGSAEVYLYMAQTHRARGDAAQARATAERGLLYCVAEAQCAALRVFTH